MYCIDPKCQVSSQSVIAWSSKSASPWKRWVSSHEKIPNWYSIRRDETCALKNVSDVTGLSFLVAIVVVDVDFFGMRIGNTVAIMV